MKEDKKLHVRQLGLYLHNKLELHLLISASINFIGIVVIVGLFHSLNYSLVQYKSVFGILIYSIIATIVMEITKLFITRHLFNVIIKTKGSIFILTSVIIFWLVTLIFPSDFKFVSNVLLKLTVFTISFIIIKVLLVILLQRVTRKDDSNERVD